MTHIYEVVEYTPVPRFKPFGEAVSDAQWAGDGPKQSHHHRHYEIGKLSHSGKLGWNNLVLRAFPFEIGTGGKRPWHWLVM